MNSAKPNLAHGGARTKPMFVAKPFTYAETIACSASKTYYALARDYAGRGDTLNAISCCLEASDRIDGITRPLAVRDQIVELVRTLDPHDRICRHIRRCMHYTGSNLAHRSAIKAECTYLERLVSAHQLIDYPSNETRFDRAYEHARSKLRQHLELRELYVVAYASELCASVNDHYFTVVEATMISKRGPFYLTDICAAVRQ